MILSNVNNNQMMDAQPYVGSTTAGGDDNNNNLSQIRSNGNTTAASPYEGNYQVDISSTNFELETITSTYTGLMRIYRLLYIAEHCPILHNEALLATLRYIQETHFISLYKQVKMNSSFNYLISMNLLYVGIG
jgi:hypothetical protein